MPRGARHGEGRRAEPRQGRVLAWQRPVFPRVVSSWIERRKVQSEKANLMILFDKYLPLCLDKLRFGFKRITPVPEVTVIQTILYLLECLLTEKNTPPDSPKELYELYFVFACFWAFGGAMFQDQVGAAPGPRPPPHPPARPRDPDPSAALSPRPFFTACRLPRRVQQVVGQRVQDHQAPLAGHRLRLLLRPRLEKVPALDRESARL